MYRALVKSGCLVSLTVGILALSDVRAIAQEAEGADPAEKAAVAEIRKLGGSVRRLASNTNDKEVDFHLTGAELTDDGLVHLAAVKDLAVLDLKGTKVTDAGLAQLKTLANLRRLHLEKTAISDAGIAHLTGLVNLEYLNLYGTSVSDAGLAHLKGLKKLKRLYLWQTEVTDEGVDKLGEMLPELTIVRGGDLVPVVRKQVVLDESPLPIAGKAWKLTGIRYEGEDPGPKATAKIYFRAKGGSDFASAELQRGDDGRFSGTIPESATGDVFQYYVDIREPKAPPATYPARGAKDPAEATPDKAPPELAADPKAGDLKSYRVTLDWQAAKDDLGIAAYGVYRGADAAGAVAEGNLLAKLEADKLQFSDEKPPAGKTAWYAIQPIDVAGRLGPPRAIKVDVPEDMPPENKLEVKASAGSKAVVLDWNGALEPDVTHILVFRADTADGDPAQVAELKVDAGQRWLDKGVSGKTKYRYVIKLRDAGGHLSQPSSEVSAEAGRYLRRINCGGPEVASPDGTPWEADTGRISGTGRFKAKDKIAGTTDQLQDVYQTERWSYRLVPYVFDAAPGRYLVTMHFAETNRAFSAKGKRKFDIFINGEKRHADVDIFTSAGAATTAWQLPTELENTGKEIKIELRKVTAGPAIKGLEIRELPPK